MPYIKTVLILSFFSGFILQYYYEKKVLREKSQSDLILGASLMGLFATLNGLVCYGMIFLGLILWSGAISGPVEQHYGGFPGLILKNIYNLLFSLFGSYTNKICAIFLFSVPPGSLWMWLKKHYSFK